jgi:hypothetical protein
MATTKRNIPAGPAAAFYKRLKAMGHTFCPTCFAYMPEIHRHTSSLAVDAHSSRYVLVGGYGHVRAVEIDAEMAEVA